MVENRMRVAQSGFVGTTPTGQARESPPLSTHRNQLSIVASYLQHGPFERFHDGPEMALCRMGCLPL
jgi:hypothetical protein